MSWKDDCKKCKTAVQYRNNMNICHTCKANKLDEMEKDNYLLRTLLWVRHGCEMSYLYGDDGEMQCNECMIDFKRDTSENILKKWHNESLKQLKEKINENRKK